MKNPEPFKKWEEKLNEHLEQVTSFETKPYIASEFLEDFIEFFTLPDLLRNWAKIKYNLNYHELPKGLTLRLLMETFAFGIRFYRLVEIETKSFFGSEGVSFTFLVDAMFEKILSLDIIFLEKYRETKRKYSEVDRKEIFNLFEGSIRNILSTSFSSFPPTSIKSSDEQKYYESRLQSRFKKFPFFVGEAVVGIFDWVLRLDDKRANRIYAEIGEIRTKEKINLNKEIINFLEVYGFGTGYWRKCGIISLFDSYDKVGKEGTLRVLRLLFKRL